MVNITDKIKEYVSPRISTILKLMHHRIEDEMRRTQSEWLPYLELTSR